MDAYHPERIYLFGSVARGDAGPDSDYDILVVVADHAPAERRRSRFAYEVLWGTGVAADVLVSTASQFEGRAHLAASLPATVIREGKLFHAAWPSAARGSAVGPDGIRRGDWQSPRGPIANRPAGCQPAPQSKSVYAPANCLSTYGRMPPLR